MYFVVYKHAALVLVLIVLILPRKAWKLEKFGSVIEEFSFTSAEDAEWNVDVLLGDVVKRRSSVLSFQYHYSLFRQLFRILTGTKPRTIKLTSNKAPSVLWYPRVDKCKCPVA